MNHKDTPNAFDILAQAKIKIKTVKNYYGYLQAVKDSLKKAWNSDEVIESLINQVKDKPELLEKVLNEGFKPTFSWMFSFTYSENATDEEIQQLTLKAIEEYQTKQPLAS